VTVKEHKSFEITASGWENQFLCLHEQNGDTTPEKELEQQDEGEAKRHS